MFVRAAASLCPRLALRPGRPSPLAGSLAAAGGQQRVERRLLIQAVAALSHEPFERLTLRVVRLRA